MNIEVHSDEQSVAGAAATMIATLAGAAVAARGRFIMALSGGRTPWLMLRTLAEAQLRWEKIHVVQVDERVASATDPQRNLVHLRQSLLDRMLLPGENMHAMPVEAADLEQAAGQYAQTLRGIAGEPPVLDLVQLGIGTDGTNASRVPAARTLQH